MVEHFPQRYFAKELDWDSLHDSVHRNGTTIEGKDIELSKESIENLLTLVEGFVGEIHQNIAKKY